MPNARFLWIGCIEHGPLRKRTFAHHFCQFGTGEDKHIEDVIRSCNPCEKGYFVLVWAYDYDQQ